MFVTVHAMSYCALSTKRSMADLRLMGVIETPVMSCYRSCEYVGICFVLTHTTIVKYTVAILILDCPT